MFGVPRHCTDSIPKHGEVIELQHVPPPLLMASEVGQAMNNDEYLMRSQYRRLCMFSHNCAQPQYNNGSAFERYGANATQTNGMCVDSDNAMYPSDFSSAPQYPFEHEPGDIDVLDDILQNQDPRANLDNPYLFHPTNCNPIAGQGEQYGSGSMNNTNDFVSPAEENGLLHHKMVINSSSNNNNNSDFMMESESCTRQYDCQTNADGNGQMDYRGALVAHADCLPTHVTDLANAANMIKTEAIENEAYIAAAKRNGNISYEMASTNSSALLPPITMIAGKNMDESSTGSSSVHMGDSQQKLSDQSEDDDQEKLSATSENQEFSGSCLFGQRAKLSFMRSQSLTDDISSDGETKRWGSIHAELWKLPAFGYWCSSVAVEKS